jgi:hypothetical protein
LLQVLPMQSFLLQGLQLLRLNQPTQALRVCLLGLLLHQLTLAGQRALLL